MTLEAATLGRLLGESQCEADTRTLDPGGGPGDLHTRMGDEGTLG